MEQGVLEVVIHFHHYSCEWREARNAATESCLMFLPKLQLLSGVEHIHEYSSQTLRGVQKLRRTVQCVLHNSALLPRAKAERV